MSSADVSSAAGEAPPALPTGISLYASAIAGAALDVAWDPDSRGLSYCDGVVVYLAPGRAEQALLDVGLQALLVRLGSLRLAAMRALLGRAARARSYLALELARGFALYAQLLPRSVVSAASVELLPAAAGSAHESLERAKRSERGMTPPAWGCLEPARVLARRGGWMSGAASGPDARQDAAVPAPAELRRQRRAAEREPEHSAVLALFRNPIRRSSGLFGRVLDDIFERQASGTGAEAGASAGSDSGEAREAPARSAQQRLVTARIADGELTELAPARAYRYPEWDDARRRYRPHFVHVAEVDPHPDNARTTPLPAPRSSRLWGRSLAGLCHGYEPTTHQALGDDIEIDALVRLHADLASGHGADGRVYRKSERIRRDLGVLVLLDITASSAERSLDGLSVFDHQLACALGLVQALHGWGDRVGLCGFHSSGAKLVRVQRLLSFGERPGAKLLERVRHVTPSGYSRLGAAIRHGSHTLKTHAGTPHRLLVVISDGLAYDHGYEHRYAAADTRRALAEARAANLACVCLSVGANTDDAALAQVFGGSCTLALPPASLPARALRALFERALREVSRRR